MTNDIDTDEMIRRLLADVDETMIEMHLGTNTINAKLLSLDDALRVEAAGATPRPFNEDTPFKLIDAIYLPILGGEVLRNGQRLASPTFKVSSLEGAVAEGALVGSKVRGKMTVTIRALRAWLESGTTEPKLAARTNAPAIHKRGPQSGLNARELERRAASSELLRQKLAGIDPKNNKK